jgi:hypothetical protein
MARPVSERSVGGALRNSCWLRLVVGPFRNFFRSSNRREIDVNRL